MGAKDNAEAAQQSGDSWRALACAYLGWVGRRLLVLGPIILIEVIHFMPVLIERYYYGGLTRSGYIGYLVAFNAPKLLFLLQRNQKHWKWRRDGWRGPLYRSLLPSLA